MFYTGFPARSSYVRDTQPGGGWDGVFVADTSHPGQIAVDDRRARPARPRQARLIVNIVLDDVVNYMPSDEPGVFTVGEARTSTLQVDPEGRLSGQQWRSPRAGGDDDRGLRAQWRKRSKPASRRTPRSCTSTRSSRFRSPASCSRCSAWRSVSTPARKASSPGLTLGLAVIFLYYVLMEIAEAWAKRRALVQPALGALVPEPRPRRAGRGAPCGGAPGPRASHSVTPAGRWLAPRSGAPDAPAPVPSPRAGAARGIVVVIRLPRLHCRVRDCSTSTSPAVLPDAGARLLRPDGPVLHRHGRRSLGEALQGPGGRVAARRSTSGTRRPRFIYYIMPIATLVAVLGTIGGLTRSSELIVMRACGVSLYRAAAPLLVLGAAVERDALRPRGARAGGREQEGGRAEDMIHDRAAAHDQHRQPQLADRRRRPDLLLRRVRSAARGRSPASPSSSRRRGPYRLVGEIHAALATCPDAQCQDGQWQATDGWEQRFAQDRRPTRTVVRAARDRLARSTDFTLAQVDAEHDDVRRAARLHPPLARERLQHDRGAK